MPSGLTVEDLTAFAAAGQVFAGLRSFVFARGEMLAVTGPNGAGKSSLCCG